MLKENNKIKSGLSIYDLSNFFLGGMDNIIPGLLLLNPQFESIDVDMEDFAAKNFSYDDQYYNPPAYQFELKTPAAAATTKKITGLENQSLYDLIIMGIGSMDRIIEVITSADNKDLFNLNDPDVSLKSCIFDTSLIVDNSLLVQIDKKRYKLSSGVERFAFDEYRITEDGITRLTDALEIRLV